MKDLKSSSSPKIENNNVKNTKDNKLLPDKLQTSRQTVTGFGTCCGIYLAQLVSVWDLTEDLRVLTCTSQDFRLTVRQRLCPLLWLGLILRLFVESKHVVLLP